MNTFRHGSPSASATAPVTASTESWPAAPVKALELPEFTMIAAPAVASALPRNLASQSRTEAERVVERVKVPASTDPGARRANITSARFTYFTPASALANSTPSMTGSAGKWSGASGETDLAAAITCAAGFFAFASSAFRLSVFRLSGLRLAGFSFLAIAVSPG